MGTAVAIFKGVNVAFELISAGQLILGKLYARQQEREADGKPLTEEDVAALMKEGDVQAALESARIAAAKAAQDAS